MFILKSTHDRVISALNDKIYHLEEKLEQKILKLYELHFSDDRTVKCVAYKEERNDDAFLLIAHDATGEERIVYFSSVKPIWYKANLLSSDTELKLGVQS